MLAVLACLVPCVCPWAQTVRAGHPVPVNPPASGWHNWIIIGADPNDPAHLIICGDKWSPQYNALSGFLYVSFDAGKSWQLKVTDKSSQWVSEESCVFGSEGHVYFVADASKVIDGLTYHSLGKTRIYRSDDAGRNWEPPTVWHVWTDHNAILVDEGKGRQGNLFIFYNNLSPHPKKDSQHSVVRVFQLPSDAEQKDLGDLRRVTMIGLFGKFPVSAKMLTNGTMIALFGMAGDFGVPSSIQVLTMQTGADAPSPLVNVMGAVPSPRCLSYPAIDVDNGEGPYHGRIYVMGVDASSGGCRIVVSHSSDNGQTWSPRVPISLSGFDVDGDITFTMGVNKNGVIGLAWSSGNNCWRFSASTDGGQSFLPSIPISDCTSLPSGSWNSFNYYMQAYAADDREGEMALHSSTPAFTLRVSTGHVWRTSMAVSSNGIFYPAWMTDGEGGGQIWTTSVVVGQDLPTYSLPPLSSLEDVSSGVTFDCTNGHYDELTHLISVDVAVTNRAHSRATVTRPLLMQVVDLHSDFGVVEAENADNGGQNTGAVWDLSNLLPADGLAPGATTFERRRMLFRVQRTGIPVGRESDLLIVKAAMFGNLLVRGHKADLEKAPDSARNRQSVRHYKPK